VYVLGVLSELADVYLRGDVAPGYSAAQTFWFNEDVWRMLAGGIAAVVFVLRLGDVHARPPSWRFAWASALWLAVATIAAANAVEEGALRIALVIVVTAVAGWLLLHRRVPGWPGARHTRGAPDGGSGRAPEGELR
jgi:hypothetical protein